jgi:DNA-binding IclR family transcriptional regulator
VLKELREAGEKGLAMKEIAAKAGINANTVKSVLQRLKRTMLVKLDGRRWFALLGPEVTPELEAELAL